MSVTFNKNESIHVKGFVEWGNDEDYCSYFVDTIGRIEEDENEELVLVHFEKIGSYANISVYVEREIMFKISKQIT